MSTEKRLNTRYIYQGRAIGFRTDEIEKSSGRITTREVIEHGNSVAIVAIDNRPSGDLIRGEEKNILLVRQYRYAVGKELLEIPAGGIELGETPAEAVCRELQEETGYFPQRVEELGGFYSAPGYCTEYLYLYLATDLLPSRLEAEDTESIEIVRVSLPHAINLVLSGDICDAKSIAGILAFIQRAGFSI